MAEITVDPVALRARANQLGEAADALIAVAGASGSDTLAGVALLDAQLVARHRELVDGLGRQAAELAELAANLRWEAEALSWSEHEARERLGVISRRLGEPAGRIWATLCGDELAEDDSSHSPRTRG